MAKFRLFNIWTMKSEEVGGQHVLNDRNSGEVKNENGGEFSKRESAWTNKSSATKRLSCDVCNFTTSHRGNLNKHKQRGCCKKYKCNMCENTKAFTKEDLKKHRMSVHDISPEASLSDSCHLCPIGAGPSHSLQKHSKKGFSKIQESFICDTCKTPFESHNDMRNHLRTSFDCFRMSCPNCDFKTFIRRSLCRHKCVSGKAELQYLKKCDECDFKDNSAARISEHIGAAHEGVILKCEFCTFTSLFKDDLDKHSRITHNVIHHLKCELCPFVGKNKIEIVNHKDKMHETYKIESDGTAICLFCNFKSKDKTRNGKTAVKRHYMTIHEQIKHTCNICNLEFARSSSLRLHMTRKHGSVVKNFNCTHCDYKANLKWLLKRHIESKHEGRRYKCPHCHYQGYDKRYTENHIKMYHQSQNTKKIIASEQLAAPSSPNIIMNQKFKTQ